MSRVDAVNRRYAACSRLVRTGVEIVAVGNPNGARFNAALQRLLHLARAEAGAYLDDLVGSSRALRWKLITQPQPSALNPGVEHLALEVTRCANRLHGAISDQMLLDELAASAYSIPKADSEVGTTLAQSIEEVGAESCVVIAANRRASAELATWLQGTGVLILAVSELDRITADRYQAFVIGPPRFFSCSLVTAPATTEVTFLLPAWFKDRSVPRSAIAAYAEGAIRIQARLFTVGDAAEPDSDVADEQDADMDYLPQPLWGRRNVADRELGTEEVEARKVLLSGQLAMWLDDGDRIRSLDPGQPPGERVTYTEISAVRPGTYLLLRSGETERSALHRAAMAALTNRDAIEESQRAWKECLAERIQHYGYNQVVKQLRSAGVRTADRARAWSDPSLIRPASDQDFERLLQWLGIPVQPSFSYATMLRKALYMASAEIGRRLEQAVAEADLSELDASGHLSLDVPFEGFRGILATRVLAVSPWTEIVPRHDARLPFQDRGGLWLE